MPAAAAKLRVACVSPRYTHVLGGNKIKRSQLLQGFCVETGGSPENAHCR